MKNTKGITDQEEKNAPGNMEFENIIKNNMVENTIKSLADQQNIDLYECKLNPFKALLQETGAILFPGNQLKIKVCTHKNYNIPCYNYIYDFRKLDKLCNIYIYLSHKYNKIINVLYFGYLCNIYNNNIYTILSTNNNYNCYDNDDNNNNNCIREFNNIKTSIYKRLKNEREENLKEKCIESVGAVGVIAVGNVENGWNLSPGQKSITTADNDIISIGQLPTLKTITTAENTENNGILAD